MSARFVVGLALLCAAPLVAQEPEVSSAGYIEMPVDDSYVLTSPTGSRSNWGRPVFVRYLTLVAREWLRRHPEGPRLRIGDMSKPDGSTFPPHKTHKDGLTADIFTSPKNVCHVNFANQDLTLELAELMHELGARQILYNGKKVIDAVPVAKSWPKHDDHFHVVIDPNRVPPDGELVLLPQRNSATGGWISSEHVDEDRTGLELGWRVLGRARISSVRVIFDDADDQNGVLHDSGPIKSRKPVYRLPIELSHNATYRWRVEVSTKNSTARLDWQTLQTDLFAPDVEPTWPVDQTEVSSPPELQWRYSKRGAEQVQFAIQFDADRNHTRGVDTLGPFPGAQTRWVVTKALRKRRTYYWRVLATDAHGNVGRSAWAQLKTAKQYDAKGGAASSGASRGGGASVSLGRVTASSLNMRSGPGTQHGILVALPKDTRVEVLARDAGWLHVRTTISGKAYEGYVSERYVQLGSAE